MILTIPMELEAAKKEVMVSFNQIEKEKFKNNAIFVVRYFGGTKLGAGGLIRAYSNVSKMVLLDF